MTTLDLNASGERFTYSLWKLVSGAKTPVLVKSGFSNIVGMFDLGGRLGFISGGATALNYAVNGDSAEPVPSDQLWISDGTEIGTKKVADGVFNIKVLKGVGYFIKQQQIWKTNGTAAGTQVVMDVDHSTVLHQAGEALFIVSSAEIRS